MLKKLPNILIPLKMKVQLFGNNKYMSDQYFDNLRFCLDFAVRYNLSATKAYRSDILVKELSQPFLSTDFGFSFMIPYGYVGKNTSHFLNRSDLFLEFYANILIERDISLLYHASSSIDNITMGGTIALNWTYQF